MLRLELSNFGHQIGLGRRSNRPLGAQKMPPADDPIRTTSLLALDVVVGMLVLVLPVYLLYRLDRGLGRRITNIRARVVVRVPCNLGEVETRPS